MLSAATFLLCFSRVGSQLSTLCSARIRFFCGLCTGDVGAIEDQRTGGGLVAVRKAHAPERWQVTLLRVMAGRLTIKTPLRPTCGRKMILGTTFPACFWLRWVPKWAELASNKGLCWDGSLDRHPRCVNTIEDGVRHTVAPKRNNSTVMAQMVDDNGVGKLVRQLVDFNDGDFVIPQKQPAILMNCSFRALVHGFASERNHPRIITCPRLNRRDIVDINACLVEPYNHTLACNYGVN